MFHRNGCHAYRADDFRYGKLWYMACGFIRNMSNRFVSNGGKQNIKMTMEVMAFVFGIGVVIVGGIYIWTFTKKGRCAGGCAFFIGYNIDRLEYLYAC